MKEKCCVDECDDNELRPSVRSKLSWIFGITEEEVQEEYKLYLKSSDKEDFEMYLAGLYSTRTCFETLDIDRW